MHEVHRLALGLAGVGVDEDDLRRVAGQEEAEREGRADGTGADDGDARRMGRGAGRRGALGHRRDLGHALGHVVADVRLVEQDDRRGAAVGRQLADLYGFKVGDTIPLVTPQGSIDGQLVGINSAILSRTGGNIGAIYGADLLGAASGCLLIIVLLKLLGGITSLLAIAAVAVAAGLVPFAIGSETWGSILTPAAYCGVTGLRPTYGLVSRYGAMALAWTMDKIGPMCRTVEDCALAFNAILNWNDLDAGKK